MPGAIQDIRWSRRAASVDDARARDIAQRLGALPAGAVVLKRDRSDWVARMDSSAGPLTVKVRRLSLAGRVRSTLGTSRFDRHWRGAEMLARAGVATPPALLLGVGRESGRAVQVLVLPFVAGRTLLEALAERPAPSEARALAERLAEQFHALAGGAGGALFNRDHKPSNLLVAGSPDAPTLVLLDCVGLRRAGPRDRWRGVDRMLASLIIEPTGVGVMVRRTDRLRVVRAHLERVWRGDADASPDELEGVHKRDWMRASTRMLWHAVDARVCAHGDPRPRVRPHV